MVRPGAADRAALTGVSSTIAAAVLQQWVQQYRAVAPGVTIDLRAATTDAAAEDQRRSGVVDFGVSEMPDTSTGDGAVVALPAVATAVVVQYNLPGLPDLRLSPVNLARIFDGSLTSWNDPSIAVDNPGRILPALRIAPVNRLDPSGAAFVLSRYLQAAAGEVWTEGARRNVSGPAALGVVGPEAMTRAVKQRTGAVGYASMADATEAGLGIAMVKNSVGQFSSPNAGSVGAFLVGAQGRPQDLVLNVPYETTASDAYPLSTFSYLLLRNTATGTAEATALRNFVRWILTEGQRSVGRAGAVPLPLPLHVRTLEALQRNDLRPQR